MVRSPRLASQCLACQIPLSGPLSLPARLMGIGRSAQNPNLCSRCGSHLSAGEIRPVALVVLELESKLRFGAISVADLAERELPALREQLKARLEDAGALVLPQGTDHPLRLQAYFNAPVPVQQPELHAFQAVTKTLRWLDTELATLALSTSWRGVLASGFVEIVACEGPLDCFPMGEVSFRASEQLERLPFAQLACDMPSFQTLFNQAPELIADLGLQPDDSPAPLNPDALVVLLDGNQTASLPASQLARLQPRSWVQSASSASQFGALLLALIAAPCAAMVVLAPGALLIGLGSLMAAALPLWKVVGMSLWPRVLITLLAVTLASLNWIRIELVQRRFRRLQQQVGGQLQLPRLQRRRLRLVRCSSITVLAVVLLEGILRVMVMKMPLL